MFKRFKGWPALFGLAFLSMGWIPFKWLYIFIGFLGNVDFVYQHRDWLKMIPEFIVTYEVWLRLGLTIIGVGLIVIAYYRPHIKTGALEEGREELPREPHQHQRTSRVWERVSRQMSAAAREVLAKELITMNEAAERLYAKSAVVRRNWANELKIRSGIDPSLAEEIKLNHVANIIARHCNLQGLHIESKEQRIIPQATIQHSHFTLGGRQFEYILHPQPLEYTLVKVKRSDIDDLIGDEDFERALKK